MRSRGDIIKVTIVPYLDTANMSMKGRLTKEGV